MSTHSTSEYASEMIDKPQCGHLPMNSLPPLTRFGMVSSKKRIDPECDLIRAELNKFAARGTDSSLSKLSFLEMLGHVHRLAFFLIPEHPRRIRVPLPMAGRSRCRLSPSRRPARPHALLTDP